MSTGPHVSPGGDVTRLTVLALLAAAEQGQGDPSQAMHGYQLGRELHRRRLDRWADIAFGSIYPALRRLAAARLVREVGTSKEGKRPERTVYRITEEGLEELRRLLRDAWSRPRFAAEPIDVALCFSSFLPSGEIVRLLDERLAALGRADAEMQLAGREPAARAAGMSELVKDLVEHRRRLLGAERDWTAHVRNRVRSGAYASEADGEDDVLGATSVGG